MESHPKHAFTKQRPGARALLVVLQIIVWIIIAISAVAIGLGRWIIATFGPITPDQALLNLQGAGQEGGGGQELVTDAVVSALIVPLGIVAIICAAFYVSKHFLGRRSDSKRSVSWAFASAATLLVVATPLLGAGSMDSALQIRQYVAAGNPSLDVGAYYAAPAFLTESPATKPNLILIYLESIEDAFADEELFELNMLEPLIEVTAGWNTIENLEQYPGGGWTMSGIVSTQCGVPLRAASVDSAATTSTEDQAAKLNKFAGETYLQDADCLGDVLLENGYKNVFLGGAIASFAGKGSFLTTHGYDTVLDLEHWLEQGETEYSERWGLSDRRLLENAKEEALELRESGEPFNLTILTLDTHEPAHRFDYCEATTDVGMTSVTACSMSLVADYVQFLEDEGFLEDTVVVLMGDHLKFTASTNSYFEELTSLEHRTIFNRIWIPTDTAINLQNADQLDMFPTVLEALGLNLEDGRAGLGVSALFQGSPVGSKRTLSDEDYEILIRSRSQSFYDSLWGVRDPYSNVG